MLLIVIKIFAKLIFLIEITKYQGKKCRCHTLFMHFFWLFQIISITLQPKLNLINTYMT